MSIAAVSSELTNRYPVTPATSTSEHQAIHKWRIYDQEISLIRNQNKLECRVVDFTKNREWQVPIEDDSHTIGEQVSYLLQCEPFVSDDGSIDFLKPIIKWRHIAIRKDVKLLLKQNELIWQMFNGTIDLRSQSFTPSIQYHEIFFREGDVRAPKYRLAQESVVAFEQVNNSCIEDRMT